MPEQPLFPPQSERPTDPKDRSDYFTWFDGDVTITPAPANYDAKAEAAKDAVEWRRLARVARAEAGKAAAPSRRAKPR